MVAEPHILIHKQEAKKTHWEWWESLETSSLLLGTLLPNKYTHPKTGTILIEGFKPLGC